MCIAIVTTAGKVVENKKLWRGWCTNGDGGGFAYVKDGHVEVEKGFMQFNDFEKAYSKAAELYAAESPMLVHMRIGTSGAKSQMNTHPFPFKPATGPAGAMIHNGTLFTPAGEWKGPKEDLKSDTRVLVNALNNVLVLEDLKNAKDAVAKAIGKSNKLAFLFDDKSTIIVNEDMGFWDDGIWYSNRTAHGGGR